jgi:hypothetical protein
MTAACPDCYEPVAVPPSAREGRCSECRPFRRHSEPRIDRAKAWQDFMAEHEARTR